MSRRLLAIGAVLLAFGSTAAIAIALWPDRDPADDGGADLAAAAAVEPEPARPQPASSAPLPDLSTDSEFELGALPADPPVRPRLKRPPAAGVLFDVESGEILWERHATIARPIASLTKLMTALLIADVPGPDGPAAISPKAATTPGSATGVLPRGKRVPLEPLLQALIMISANDAAVALAEAHSGSVTGFIAEMNRRARRMGLTCTRFTTPNGLKDRGNHSCALDVAELARAALAEREIALIARTRYAKPAFPIKGGRLHLANNHYFLQRGLQGIPSARVTGLKTGFTDAAGRCYVTTARVGSTHLGVVLLGSPDPLRQVPLLLRAGFLEAGAISPASDAPKGPRAGDPTAEAPTP